ncbi:MAG: hypothetical protein ABSH08_01495 [Tepidisphaeraceae bacterium]|jgi:hypothetical protein
MGSEAADTAGALDFAVGNTDKVTNEIGSAGSFDRTDLHDPQQQLEYKRAKIEGEHQGLRGLVGSGYSALGIQPSYQQEMDELTEAQQYSASGDMKFSADSGAQQENARLQQLRAQLDATAASETKTEFQRQMESIGQNYLSQLQAADHVANDKTFWSQRFKSQAEANAFADHLRQSASAIHDAEFYKLERGKLIELGSDQDRLSMLKKAAAGDTTGAAREALGNQLESEEDAIDPNDKERLQRFGTIRQQTLANFDASAARQSKFQAAQSDERVQALHEEAQEAQLRAEGKTDEARAAGVKFSTEQRVCELHEGADAENDPARKQQLLREAAAADEAGKQDRDALQKELQRTNAQASALNSTQHGGLGSNVEELAGRLADTARKLDDGATKLDKVFSNAKTSTLLKD